MAKQITVNGETRNLEREMTVRELIEEIGLDPRLVAVERNRAIVKRDSFDSVVIEDADQIEIVQFVGGG